MTAIRNRRVTLIKSKAGLPLKDYDAHWSGPHAAIAKDLPGLIWYVQNHVVRCLTSPQGRFGEAHGIAEVAFEDPEKLRGTVTGWSRVGELRADETAFLGDKFTFVTEVPNNLPELHQRRIIAMLERPSDGSDGPGEDELAKVAEALSAVGAAHAEMVTNDPDMRSDDPETQPHALIFVELPVGVRAEALTPGGPILGPIAALNLPASVYLVAAEAKRLPIDLPQ